MPKASFSQVELLQKQKEYLREVVIDVETMAIFDSLPGFLCFLKNRAGEHLYASGLWTTRHGFREAWEMLFKTDQDLTPGAMAESYLADDAIVYRTGKPVVDKIEICLDAVGLPDWHVTSKYPVRNRKGEIIGILGISRVCMGQAPVASQNAKIGPATKMLQENLLEYPSAEVLAEACELWRRAGIPTAEALTALMPLAQTSLETFGATGRTGHLSGAVAGPVARGDLDVIDAHLRAFAHAGIESALYRAVARKQVSLMVSGDALPADVTAAMEARLTTPANDEAS